jgi:hypothetical protein
VVALVIQSCAEEEALRETHAAASQSSNGCLERELFYGFANSWTNWNGTLFRKGREART